VGDDVRFLIRFLDRDFMVRLLFLGLLCSLLPLGEIVIILLAGDALGRYLTLAVTASTGLLGALLAARQVGGLLAAARGRIRSGEYPGDELVEIAGTLVAGILLMTPGFVTDAAGLVTLLPPLRRRVGRMVTRRLQRRLTEVYEYLRLYDL
jgi:UPF0716 protein FxsA